MIISESFWATFEASVIFGTAGSVSKTGSSLKPNHHNQVKLVQNREMLCRTQTEL